jgi:hypothetical protein
VEPDAAEIRVLGCLIEKQRTTPDAYPLTLNSLRLACNQSTNRDPLVDYDEGTIRDALERIGRRGWTRLATWSNRRTMKYRHLFDEALGLSEAETALLCVLMLRGAADVGRAQAAHRAPPRVRRHRGGRADARRPLRARAREAACPAPGRAGPALRAAGGRRGRGAGGGGARPVAGSRGHARGARAGGPRHPPRGAARRAAGPGRGAQAMTGPRRSSRSVRIRAVAPQMTWPFAV